jgi:5-(carboxyamino)imidazole ribonucleotide synthase
MNIGILGAGQLSRMLAIAGIPMGFNFIFYSPSDQNCVKNLGKVINKSYDDQEAVIEFASSCDVITYENENIP